MKTTTAKELFDFLERVVHDGYGHAEILFDTEARKFEYHMAKVDRAYLELDFDPDRPYISLHEEG
jgi:hypothetical protein